MLGPTDALLEEWGEIRPLLASRKVWNPSPFDTTVSLSLFVSGFQKYGGFAF